MYTYSVLGFDLAICGEKCDKIENWLDSLKSKKDNSVRVLKQRRSFWKGGEFLEFSLRYVDYQPFSSQGFYIEFCFRAFDGIQMKLVSDNIAWDAVIECNGESSGMAPEGVDRFFVNRENDGFVVKRKDESLFSRTGVEIFGFCCRNTLKYSSRAEMKNAMESAFELGFSPYVKKEVLILIDREIVGNDS